jgi:hypothetical protein
MLYRPPFGKKGMKITGSFLLITLMRNITFSVLMLFVLAACSNPIDASEDNEGAHSSDTSLRTDPGDGVSTQTDSLHKEDKSSPYPSVNTVTGEVKQPKQGEGENKGTQGATGASGEAAPTKPHTK